MKAPQRSPDERRLREIVAVASTEAPGNREVYVRTVCNGDFELENRVLEYLQIKHRFDRILELGAIKVISDAEAEEDPFEPGQILLNRFRLTREAGRGGMGIVYEAFDETLQKRVALKCAHSGFDRQLIPEVKHASEISHPNVCKIFDIHQAFTAKGEEISFISMEFLEGTTLADRMDERSLNEPEARTIALELCRGLFAAHRNRVVHGDLKTNNIMLAKGPDGAIRAVITDFGLARHGELGRPGFQSGVRGGAPVFMAPEVREGGRPSVASDVYALGVILHLLATGKSPQEGKIKAKAPANWRAVIAQALEADPLRRYRSADAMARDLDPAPQHWSSVGAAAAVLGILFWPSQTKDQVRLAVLPFSASAPARAAADRLYADASQQISRLRGDKTKTLRFIPAEDVRRKGAGTPDEARELLNATHAFTANMREIGGRYVVEAALVDVASGAKARQWSAEYAASELSAAPVALAGVVSGGLHLPTASADEMSEDVRADYKRGMALSRENTKAAEALEVFERLAPQAPRAAAIPAAAAEACFTLHYATGQLAWLERAAAFIRQAERLNPDTPEVRKAAGYLEAVSGHPYAAIPHYLRAAELRPADSVIWRRLGKAYEMSDRQEEAESAFLKAIACEPRSSRTHQQLGSYYFSRSNYDGAVGCFRRATELAPENPDTHYALGAALVNLGRFGEAEPEFRASAGLGDSSKVQNSLGVVLMYQRREAEAIPHFRRALELEPELVVALQNWGISARRIGRTAESTKANRRGLEIAERKLAANPQDGNERALLANLAAACGDRRRAELEVAQAARSLPNDNVKRFKLVAAYELLGSREEALRELREAPLALLEELARWPDAEALGGDPRFQSLIANARTKETK